MFNHAIGVDTKMKGEPKRNHLGMAEKPLQAIAIFDSMSDSGICLYRLVVLEKPLNEYYVVRCPFCDTLMIPIKEGSEEKATCLECGVII